MSNPLSCYVVHTRTFDRETIVRFTLNSSTRIIEFRRFLSQLSTNFHGILHTLFSIYVVTTLFREVLISILKS